MFTQLDLQTCVRLLLNMKLLFVQVLTGHTGSVLCLQYDDKVIISGSSDSTVRVWDVATGEMVNTLIHHCEAVLHLRFYGGMMVTCSKVTWMYSESAIIVKIFLFAISDDFKQVYGSFDRAFTLVELNVSGLSSGLYLVLLSIRFFWSTISDGCIAQWLSACPLKGS